VSRNVLLESDYTFNPSTYTLTLRNKWIPQERIMLITNVTRNVVYYNFSDSTKSLTSVTKLDTGDGLLHTVIVLNSALFSGTTQLSTDKIQIYIDEYAQTFIPEETFTDAAQKQRVTTPQSLIDTDFEYSIQPSKWETIFLTNNYPSYFPKPNGGNAITATSISGDGASPRSLITVTSTLPHGFVTGNIINVQETLNARVEGTFLITSVPSIYSFTYRARGVVSGEQIYQGLTTVYGGDVYDGAHIPGGNYPGLGAIPGAPNTLDNSWLVSTDAASPSNITLTFKYPHGMLPGQSLTIAGTNSFDGDFIIHTVPSMTQLIFQATTYLPSVNNAGGTGRVIAKSDGYVIHRPYDAGVAITTYNNVPGLQTIRQTRRYFRYQAGKGMQFSTGAKLTPTFNIDSISSSTGVSGQTALVTVTTMEDHGMQAGATVYVENVQVTNVPQYNPYNGSFVVASVLNSNVFTYQVTLTQNLPTTDLTPNGQSSYAHCTAWVGAETRAGMYDEQNGFYFSFNGTNLAVNRRHSEKVLSGRINLTQNSPLVTGTGTQFRKQLVVGNKIVIKGSSYLITAISSDTQLYVAPAYKGLNATGQRATITQNIQYPQSSWNMDKCDGTGPSGYTIDTKRMQMIYIDYSWYGAGTIRFGVRGPRGNIIYVHRIVNSNTNQLAYQKSGNLPARYEVDNAPITFSRLTSGGAGVEGAQLNATDSVLYVDNVTNWATSGYLLVKDDTNIEIMTYNGIGAYNTAAFGYPVTLTGRRQSISLIYPDQPFTFKATTQNQLFTPDSSITGVGGSAQVAVQPINQTCAPIIQHWGSSVVMDGGYQQDLLAVFTGGMTKYQTIAAGITRPLLAIRPAPSVDNAIARNYGIRELINRMALNLQSIGVQTNGSYRIDVILNPSYLGYTNWTTAQLTVTRSSVSGTSGNNFFLVNDTGTINIAGVTGLGVGMFVTGSGVQANTYITNIQGNIVTLSTNLTGNTTGSYTFTPTTPFTGLPNDWARDSVGQSSLAQVLYFDNAGSGQGNIQTASGIITGGDSIFSFYTENGGGASNYNSSIYSLVGAKDIGNSYMSGNGNVSTPGFPNGPDVIVIQATNIGIASSQISARISWTEAQA